MFRVTVYKEFAGAPFNGEKWSNVYLFNSASSALALSRGVAAGVAEMSVSYEPIIVTRVVAVDTGNPNDKASASPGSVAVLDPTGLGGYLPLFNTVRVIFSDNQGRPESKYLRTGATPAQIGAGEWDGEYVTLVNDDYATAILAIPDFSGPSQEVPTTALVQVAIQNRQLGWHRRSRPGFVRGWVPA